MAKTKLLMLISAVQSSWQPMEFRNKTAACVISSGRNKISYRGTVTVMAKHSPIKTVVVSGSARAADLVIELLQQRVTTNN